MNSSSSELATELNIIQVYLARYFLVPTYVFGNLGNIANLALFSQRNLRSNNVCAFYFIGLSLANLLVLNIGGLTRILSLLTNFKLETTSIIFCKTRNYFIQVGVTIARYFICLISIERWMVTSSNETIRRMSSPKSARRLIIFGPCMITIFIIHVPIGYQIVNNRCYASLNAGYTLFFNIYNMMIILVPIIVMTLFSILILVNVRQSRRRVVPTSTVESRGPQVPTIVKEANQKRDLQFIQLALIQAVTFMLFAIGYGIYNMYDLITSSVTKSNDRRAIEAFILGVMSNSNYGSNAITFYSYILASVIFRKECVATLHRFGTRILRGFG